MLYRITIKPSGTVGTPFRSDTLFGHACWAIALHEGEDPVALIIEKAKRQEPDIVFSDGFPSGYLPLPQGLLTRAFAPQGADSLEQRQKWKQLKRTRWVNRQAAEKAGWKLEIVEDKDFSAQLPREHTLLRNVIDRHTGASLNKNGLYQVSNPRYSKKREEIDIYAQTNWSGERITQVMQWIFETGYGRDATVGCGAVSNMEITGETFPTKTAGSYFMSLSRFVPCGAIDMEKSFWAIEAKYGKAWKEPGSANSFKKPIMQTVPGSIFSAGEVRERYGRVLENIHTDSRVVENCMTIPYWLPPSFSSGVADHG